MPGPPPTPLLVTDEQQHILEALLRQHKAPQRRVQRARIILAAAEGLGLTQTARRLDCSLNMVQTWRDRWIEATPEFEAAQDDPRHLRRLIEATLDDASRSGAPLRFSAHAVAQIIALACEDPARSVRPVTHWTNEELADEAIKRGLVKQISPRSVGRFLKRSRAQAAPVAVLAPPRDR